jgi:sulfatase modifying factor 1
MGRVWSIVLAVCAVGVACSRNPPAPQAQPHDGQPLAPPTAAPTSTATALAEPSTSVASGYSASVDAGPDDPMDSHFETQADLLKLVWLPDVDPRAIGRRDATLSYLVAPSPGHFNQGNRAMAHHAIGKRACLDGLRDVTIQTDEQRAICGGAPNMVPIYTNGDPSSAKVCIDVFEFPNRACELPFVWGSPSEAETMCRTEGKRLCSDKEWNVACAGDPEGKKKWAYAYGDKLDMTACHTREPKEVGPDGKTWVCNVHDAQSTWQTCSTDTEPSGSFPRCRSRLGVFDQHGNVAEEMTRAEGDVIYTQLKGSAWFYVDVGREPGKAAWHPERESYPDTCNYDPRWHVEVLKESLHVNYHLGFRCCKDVAPGK